MVSSDSSALNTATKPISLDLKSSHADKNIDGITVSCRTKPQLIQSVLQLKPGEPFSIDVGKWKALKNCGLFKSLTARSYISGDGVGLHVSGIEQNTRRCKPELSVIASLDKPEITGGVSNL
jgi:hypothetical protein